MVILYWNIPKRPLDLWLKLTEGIFNWVLFQMFRSDFSFAGEIFQAARSGTRFLPWVSVCWLPAAPSRSLSPGLPWRRCACVRVRWGCACRRGRRSCLWTVPPHGCAARGWRRPGAPDGPRCDSAAGRQRHSAKFAVTTLLTPKIIFSFGKVHFRGMYSLGTSSVIEGHIENDSCFYFLSCFFFISTTFTL